MHANTQILQRAFLEFPIELSGTDAKPDVCTDDARVKEGTEPTETAASP